MRKAAVSHHTQGCLRLGKRMVVLHGPGKIRNQKNRFFCLENVYPTFNQCNLYNFKELVRKELHIIEQCRITEFMS